MRVAFLPLDNRPVTRDAFLALAAAAGLDVITPPKDRLGDLKTPADVDGLWGWVAGEGADADLLVASAELLVYGGLVPSRIGREPLDRCLALARRWRETRRRAPHRRLFLTASNMRLPSTADSTEEPDYWATYGPDVFAHSYHADRYARTHDPASQARAAAARAAVPPAVLADVRWRRARNLAVLLVLVDLAADGVLDALLVGQDDAAEYGWTRRDLGAVETAVRERGASSRAWVTYGTDELAVRLLARAVVRARDAHPRVRVVYSHPDNLGAIPRYEGQGVDATVTSHVETAGCRRAAGEADLSLFVHNFPGAQEEAPHQRPYDPGTLDAFFGALDEAASRGPCALADVRYSNGADRTLVARLLASPWPHGVRAYGGWNTLSNTLGMALAQALVARGDAGREFTVLRLLDDWAYQADIRQRLAAEILPGHPGASSQDLGDAYPACRDAAKAWLVREFVPPIERCLGCGIEVRRVEFPWRRLFNIELGLRVV
ncbi:MAG TPA: DUF4127 family protein [bacterium]|nr:DUF4127 family protein [bacterium]